MTSLIDTSSTRRSVTGDRSVPDAIRLLPADAPREDWLAARRLGIGGSDASVIAGVNRFSSLYGLWLEKTGQAVDKPATDYMEFGTRCEPVLAQWFADLTGIGTRRAGLMQSRDRAWQLASVDRLTDDGGILELKTTGERMADEWDDDQVADHAEIQTQHYLSVTGRSHAWVFALIGRSPVIRRVERDDDLIADLIAMESAFWHDNVLAGVEPVANAAALPAIKDRFSSIITETVDLPADTVLPLLDAWQAAKAALKAAQDAADDAEARLRAVVAGVEEVRVAGTPVLTCKANGTFSPKKFEADHPDLAAACQTTKTVLDVDRIKADHPAEYASHRARVLRASKAA